MATIIQATEDFLKKANKPKTVKEIYEGIKNDIGEHSGDPYYTLSGILSQNLKKSTSKLFVVNYDIPRTIWLKDRKDELKSLGIHIKDEDNESIDATNVSDINEIEYEKDMYPIIVDLLQEDSIYAKRINEKLTEKGKKGLNKWINPDIVGVKYFFEEHNDDVNELMINNASPIFELYSYEVKKEITLGNIKECYFQAVSNSSWANYGYLVCDKFDEGNEDLITEIERLVGSYGIGLIIIEGKKIKKKFTAKYKVKLDYPTIENLYGKNEDFRAFIEKVNDSVKTRRVQEL